MYNVTWYLYPYYGIENTGPYKVHLKPDRKQQQYQIIQSTSKATPNFGMYVSWKEFIWITKNAAMMCGMHNKWSTWNKGRQEETNPVRRFRRLFLDLLFGDDVPAPWE